MVKRYYSGRYDCYKRVMKEETIVHHNTVEHDFNGHVINGIHEVNGKKCNDRAFHFVNKLHDFKEIHDLSGNFCYDVFFRKTHVRLYPVISIEDFLCYNILVFPVSGTQTWLWELPSLMTLSTSVPDRLSGWTDRSGWRRERMGSSIRISATAPSHLMEFR